MDNENKPAYLVKDEPWSAEYNLGMMDALLWSKSQLSQLIVNRKLTPADIRKVSGLMQMMIADCIDQRLVEFQETVVPFQAESDRIDALVDGMEIEEVHIKK